MNINDEKKLVRARIYFEQLKVLVSNKRGREPGTNKTKKELFAFSLYRQE